MRLQYPALGDSSNLAGAAAGGVVGQQKSYWLQGLITGIPANLNGETSRVAIVNRWWTAIAAMKASATPMALPVDLAFARIPAYAVVTASSNGRMRPSNSERI